MFKVKATVISAQGDLEKYPCHFNYKIGDEIICTGAEYKGRICSAILNPLSQKVIDLYNAGPRWVESSYYYPFWYSTASPVDPSMKKYDGIGFKPILKTLVEPKYHMANLRDPNTFIYPPCFERIVNKDITFMCPDLRTAMVFKVEAFDLADDGDSITYFRRMMVMLSRIKKKPNISIDKILNEFTEEEINNIHPVLSQIMIKCLSEELELMKYLDIKNGKATITDKGVKKLKDFKSKLTSEEKAALRV
jgi:uncharacterized repeat protein (TIGR04076 family)